LTSRKEKADLVNKIIEIVDTVQFQLETYYTALNDALADGVNIPKKDLQKALDEMQQVQKLLESFQ